MTEEEREGVVHSMRKLGLERERERVKSSQNLVSNLCGYVLCCQIVWLVRI